MAGFLALIITSISPPPLLPILSERVYVSIPGRRGQTVLLLKNELRSNLFDAGDLGLQSHWGSLNSLRCRTPAPNHLNGGDTQGQPTTACRKTAHHVPEPMPS